MPALDMDTSERGEDPTTPGGAKCSKEKNRQVR